MSFFMLLTLQRANKYLSRRLYFIRKPHLSTLYIIKHRSYLEIGSSASCAPTTGIVANLASAYGIRHRVLSRHIVTIAKISNNNADVQPAAEIATTRFRGKKKHSEKILFSKKYSTFKASCFCTWEWSIRNTLAHDAIIKKFNESRRRERQRIFFRPTFIFSSNAFMILSIWIALRPFANVDLSRRHRVKINNLHAKDTSNVYNEIWIQF